MKLSLFKFAVWSIGILCLPNLALAKADGAAEKEHLKIMQVCESIPPCFKALIFDAHIYEPTPREFLEKVKDLPAGTIILISGYGRDLAAGTLMGEIIRQKKFKTRVGRVGAANLEKTGFYKIKGVCISACAMAFMGGVSRQIDSEDKFGVTAIKPTRANLTEREYQQALTDTENYIDRMGVDGSFFVYLRGLKGDTLNLLEYKLSILFNIDNYSPK
jgi:hypothetical protein